MRETERAPPSMGMYPGFSSQPMYSGAPGLGFPPNNNNNLAYRLPPSNMIPPPGMPFGMPGQGMNFPPTSATNFQIPSLSSGPGSFQNQMMQQPPVTQQQMMPGLNQHHQPMTNGLPQNTGNMQPMGVPQQQMMSGQTQQQIQAPGEKF